MAVRNQLNASHAQLNKKLRMDYFLPIRPSQEGACFSTTSRYNFFLNLAERYFRQRLSEKLTYKI